LFLTENGIVVFLFHISEGNFDISMFILVITDFSWSHVNSSLAPKQLRLSIRKGKMVCLFIN